MGKTFIALFTALFFGFYMQGLQAQNNSSSGSTEVPQEVQTLVDQKLEHNAQKKTYSGYKIQIFYGSEKNCYEQRDEFEELYPEIKTSVIFSTPQWKLQVGEYKTRLEADRAIVDIKKEYPSAIVLATEIEYE